MQSKGSVKHFILAFMLALVGYAACYLGIEHWRPQRTVAGNLHADLCPAPVITIDQPGLAMANVKIIFTPENLPASK